MKKLKLNVRGRKVCAVAATLATATVWAASPEIIVEKGSPREVGGGGGGVCLLEADPP